MSTESFQRQFEPLRTETRIDVETILMPWIIADTVIQQIGAHLELAEELPREWSDMLADRAERCYAANDDFRKKIKGRAGREYLYVFMRHWLTAIFKEQRPDLYKRLPDQFWKGAHPETGNFGGR